MKNIKESKLNELPNHKDYNEIVPKYIRIKQLSKLINIPVYSLKRMIHRGELPAYLFSPHCYLFDPEEIFEFIKQKKQPMGKNV